MPYADQLKALWDIPNTKTAIITFFTSIALELFRRAIVPKARVVFGIKHQHHFIIEKTPPQANHNIRMREIAVQNVGRVPAEDVELVINYRPEHYDIWPPIVAVETPNTTDRFLRICAKTLNRNEYFSISMIDGSREIPLVVSVRWKGGIAKEVPIGMRIIYPKFLERIVLFMIYIGIISVVFFFVRLVVFLASK